MQGIDYHAAPAVASVPPVQETVCVLDFIALRFESLTAFATQESLGTNPLY